MSEIYYKYDLELQYMPSYIGNINRVGVWTYYKKALCFWYLTYERNLR